MGRSRRAMTSMGTASRLRCPATETGGLTEEESALRRESFPRAVSSQRPQRLRGRATR